MITKTQGGQRISGDETPGSCLKLTPSPPKKKKSFQIKNANCLFTNLKG